MAETTQISTRERLENAIKAGGSTFVTLADGTRKHVTSISELPSEAELSKGNPEREKQALNALKAQMLQIQAQAELLGGFPVEEAPVEKEAPVEAPKSETHKKKEDK